MWVEFDITPCQPKRKKRYVMSSIKFNNFSRFMQDIFTEKCIIFKPQTKCIDQTSLNRQYHF